MRAFYSSLQRHFDPPPVRLLQAREQAHPDSPARLDAALAAVKAAGLSLYAPRHFDPFEHWRGVHTRRYVEFLRDGTRLWQEAGLPGLPRPLMHPHQRPARRPHHPQGIAGWHMADDMTPFCRGLWPAVRAAADTAISGHIRETLFRQIFDIRSAPVRLPIRFTKSLNRILQCSPKGFGVSVIS